MLVYNDIYNAYEVESLNTERESAIPDILLSPS